MPPRYDVESGRYEDPRGISDKSSTRSTLSLLYKRFGFNRRPKILGSPRNWLLGIIFFIIISYTFRGTFNIWKRDLGYIFRPIWDKPEPPWNHIIQYSPPGDINDKKVTEKWCSLHNWSLRDIRDENDKPKIIDAILFSSELDLLEIRLKEYEPFIDLFIIVESNMTFSGQPKPLYFQENLERYERFIPKEKIKHIVVTNFEKNLPLGSFQNEIKQRLKLGEELRNLIHDNKIKKGDLIIQSDVDEIISRETLLLLSTCKGYSEVLHLNVKNFRYSFEFPLNDDGYFRPKVVTVNDINKLEYNHGRFGNDLLGGSGWHCSFCLKTLSEIRSKMLNYSHNDRMSHKGLIEMKRLRKTVCEGRDPFDMYPEAFTFKDIVAQSGKPRKAESYTNVPVALKENPDRFSYLLEGGCDRAE